MAVNHVNHLGRLVGNLQSLELGLRLCLLKEGAAKRRQLFQFPSRLLSAGEEVAEDEFTNYDTLGELIKKFNAQVAGTDPVLAIDPSVVGIRDLLAHGRVSADAPDEARLEIIKFDRPSRGKVRVVAAALMDEKWFVQSNQLVRAQQELVAAALYPDAANTGAQKMIKIDLGMNAVVRAKNQAGVEEVRTVTLAEIMRDLVLGDQRFGVSLERVKMAVAIERACEAAIKAGTPVELDSHQYEVVREIVERPSAPYNAVVARCCLPLLQHVVDAGRNP